MAAIVICDDSRAWLRHASSIVKTFLEKEGRDMEVLCFDDIERCVGEIREDTAAVFMDIEWEHKTGRAGVINIIIGFDACFERKRSIIPLVVYFLIKNTVTSWFTSANVYRPYIPGLGTVWVILITLMSVLSFVVIWYTWQDDPVRIGIVGIINDTISGMSIIAGASLMNLLNGTSLSGEMLSLEISDTPAVILISVALYALSVRLLAVPIRFFRSYSIRHRRAAPQSMKRRTQ